MASNVFPTLPVSHLAGLHATDSKLLVAVHFLDKEEQEELIKTAQPRMMIEERRRGEGEACLPPTPVDRESTFTSVAMKVFTFFILLFPFLMSGENVGKGGIL